jgi:diguanylate cyclase (GGDEF)-like protein
MLLSTDMQDAVGDFPYKRELECINRDGECFNTYYFKQKDSDNFARKITYSKLYAPYNWVVCMGSYYDDIYDSVSAIKKMKKNSPTRFAFPLFIALDVLLLAFIISRASVCKKENESFKGQSYIDPLTEAHTRDYGKRRLSQEFAAFKTTNETPAVMLMDVDNFKTINDTDGRDAGDYALSKLVNIFFDQSRSSDVLIRWDGDKFMGIFDGMKKTACWHYSQKLLESISSQKFTYNEKDLQVTVSIGFSFFSEEDKNYLQVVERAEKALKEAKGAGKNRARVE